jgi:hypothetical protein
MTEHFKLCVVAFIDVLGWRDLVRRAYDQPDLLEKMAAGLDSAGGFMGADPARGHPVIVQFSDSIIGYVDLSPAGVFLPILLDIIHGSCQRFAMNGLFVRGALLSGALYYKGDGKIAFGPALTEAAHIEKNVARYCRVVIPQDAIIPFEGRGPWRRKDADGELFLDILAVKPFDLTYAPTPEVAAQHRRTVLEAVTPHVQANLALFKSDPHVLAKYVWFANYFNIHAREIGATEIAVP